MTGKAGAKQGEAGGSRGTVVLLFVYNILLKTLKSKQKIEKTLKIVQYAILQS